MNFSSLQKNLFINQKTIPNFLAAFLFLIFLSFPGYLSAACSPYMGLASFNEFFKDKTNQDYDADDFVEVKLLDPSITSSIYDTWTIRICEDNDAGNNNDADGCSSPIATPISLSTFTDTNYPWITLKGGIGRYVNFKTGFDAILLDGNGDVIDYLTVDTYNPQEQAGCNGSSTPSLPFDYQASSPGASDKFIYRTPDGTGDWGSAPSASAPPTEEDTNDTAPGGGTPPIVSVANVTVNKGQTATFTFTLEKTVTYPVSVDYITIGGNAIADTAPQVTFDYTYKTGTITFAANTTTLTQTVDISTNSVNPSTTNTVYFYLKLFNQINAKIVNSFPIGTILGNTTGEWYMDEASWSNTANEVSDKSSSANHGTPSIDVTTTSPGKLCNAGSFDGNDYIEIPHSASLVGTTHLTYSVWIRPTTWSGSIRQVIAKSVHGGGAGRAQMGIFSEGGRLVGRAETAANRYEVYADLPALNNWTHVVLAFNGSSLIFYINGVNPANISATYPSFKMFSSTTLLQNNDPLTIGKKTETNQYFFSGLIDEVLVMQSALPGGFIKTMYDNYQAGLNWDGTSRSCGGLDHFSINYNSSSGTGVNCQEEAITLTAHDASHNTFTTYTGSVNLSTTTTNGNWTKTSTASDAFGVLTPGTADSGSASYNFLATDSGSVILNYKNTHIETTNLNITNGTITETSGSNVAGDDYQIAFAKTGFNFLATTPPSPTAIKNTIGIQIGGKASNVAPSVQTFELQAIKTNGETGACEAAFTGTTPVEIAVECIDPVNCTGDKLFVSTDGGSTFDQIDGTPELTYTAITDFDFGNATDTTAPFVIRYDDVGKIKLLAQKTLIPSNEVMAGESNEFVVRPFAFYPYVTSNPAATTSAGTAFTTAGTDFTVNVKAVLWQSIDDDASGGVGTASDGIADGHESTDTNPANNVDLSDNTIASNYGQETTTEQALLNSLLNQPSPSTTGVVDPGLDDSSANANRITSFSAATGIGTSATINYDEVGIIEIFTTVNDGDYLAIGTTETTKIVGRSGFVGRFYPHHFETDVTHACGTFTYSGQPFIATVYARNLGNVTTRNYRDAFAYTGVTLSDANPAATPTGIFANNTMDATSFSSDLATNGASYGVGSTQVANNFSYTFNDKRTIPDLLEIRATDIKDSTSSNGFTEGTTEVRSGRTRVENSYGSELVDMAITANVEYYNTNGFEINTSDTCSALTATLTDIGTDPITIGTGSGATQTCIIDDDGESGTDNCSDASVLPGPIASQFESPAIAGNFNLFLKAPGANNTGDISITLNSPAWLKFDWDGDGVHDNEPTGIASFGLYRGDDRIIYWREVF